MKRVQNKVAIVTGGAAGLGEAIVRCLVSESASKAAVRHLTKSVAMHITGTKLVVDGGGTMDG